MVLETLNIGCGLEPTGDVNCDIENVYLKYGCCPMNFVVASAIALPFKDKSFKATEAKEILEHLDDDEALAALKEMKRVGNRAMVTVPNAYFTPASWKYSWTSIGTLDRKRMLKYPHKQMFDEVMLRDALSLVFSKVRVEGGKGTWFSIPLLERILSLLSRRITFLAKILVAYCE